MSGEVQQADLVPVDVLRRAVEAACAPDSGYSTFPATPYVNNEEWDRLRNAAAILRKEGRAALTHHDTSAPLADPGLRDAVEALEKSVAALAALARDGAHTLWARAFLMPKIECVEADLAALSRLDPAARGAGTRAWPAGYQETFNAIAKAVTVYPGGNIGIDVKAFYRDLAYPETPCSDATPQDAEATVRGGGVSSDLHRRCAEIVDWRRTGTLKGDALRRFAETDARCKDYHDAIGLAESVTLLEAAKALAAAPSEPEAGTGGDWLDQPIQGDLVFGNGTFRKGVPLRLVIEAARRWKERAQVAFDAEVGPFPIEGAEWLFWNQSEPSSSIAPRPAETRSPDDGDGSQGATVAGQAADYGPGRCQVCGWTLADSPERGCVPGDCSYRPDDPAEQRRIDERRLALAAPTPSNTVATPLDPASTPADPAALDKPCISARDAFPDRKGDWMQTFTGRRFWPLDPRPEDICVEDIAHALSLQTRYGGHCLRFYSVAEHCVRVARAAAPEDALWALLHDASEAYLADVIRPLKRHLQGYGAAEIKLMGAVCARFDLDGFMPAAVKALDNRILMDERAQVMCATADTWNYGGATEPLGVTIEGWPPERAEREFLAEFARLSPPADPTSVGASKVER